MKGAMKKIGIAEPSYSSEEVEAVLRVMRSGRLKQGPTVRELEERFSEYFRMESGVAVNSGSSANLLVFEVLKAMGDLKPGDEVITAALTWPTTVYPIVQVGCNPIFVDSDPSHMCIDPEKIESAITERTKALVIIHYCGHPCEMDRIIDIVEDNDLLLIEDCCQSHGATYKGQMTGSFGDFSTFSFATTHGMTCGEGGMVLMKDERYDRVARSIREFGRACSCKICRVSVEGLDKCPYGRPSELRFTWSRLGYSFRLTEIQAAFALVQLKKLEAFNEKRRKNVGYLAESLSKVVDWLHLPYPENDCKPAWIVCPLVINHDSHVKRENLIRLLEEKNIEARILFSSLLNQPVRRLFKYEVRGTIETAKWVDKKGLMVGCQPSLSREDLDRIVGSIENFDLTSFRRKTKQLPNEDSIHSSRRTCKD